MQHVITALFDSFLTVFLVLHCIFCALLFIKNIKFKFFAFLYFFNTWIIQKIILIEGVIVIKLLLIPACVYSWKSVFIMKWLQLNTKSVFEDIYAASSSSIIGKCLCLLTDSALECWSTSCVAYQKVASCAELGRKVQPSSSDA